MSTEEKGSKPGLIIDFNQDKRSRRRASTAEEEVAEKKSDQTACSTPVSNQDAYSSEQGDNTTSATCEKQHVSTEPEKSKNGHSVDELGNTYPEGGLRAWLVTIGCLCGMFAGFGVMNTIGIFNAYISTHQLKEYDESTISWIFSIYIFLVFGCGLLIGPVFDAFGSRLLMIVGSICVVVSIFFLGICTAYWHFILSFSLLGGLGASLLFTPSVSTVSHYFNRRRGTATGIACTGGSFGGIIFPLMLERLIPRIGWAWATRVLAFLLLALCVIAVALTNSRLSAVDRVKAAQKQAAEEDDGDDAVTRTTTGTTIPRTNWRSALPRPSIFFDGTGHVLLTAMAIFFLEWGLFIPVTYLPAYALATGTISPAFSSQLIAIFNAASCFGRYLPGLAADHLGRYNTMIATVVLCILGVGAFWLPSALLVAAGLGAYGGQTQTGLISTFAVVFGFASGANISLTPICIGQLCDTREYGLYYATCYTVVAFGTLTGIPIAGALLRVGGQEDQWWAVVTFVGCCYAAALGCFAWVRVGRVGWGLKSVF